jgi:hypothetical protein
LLGDLFFNALMKNFESYIQDRKLETRNEWLKFQTIQKTNFK